MKMKFKEGKGWDDLRALLSDNAFDFAGLHDCDGATRGPSNAACV